MQEHGPVTTRLPGPWNRAPVTQRLIELLRSSEAEKLTDDELEQAIGRSCRVGDDGYGSLMSAIKYVLRQHRIVWKRERGASCIIRADKLQCFQIVEGHNRSIRRLGRRGLGTMAAVKDAELTDEERRAKHAAVAAFGSLILFTEKTTRKALEARRASIPPARERLLGLWNGQEKE